AIQADTGAIGPWTKEFIFGNETSEDCLYLNVWTAAKASSERRPVLVFIHGGAFTGGSGEVAVYDGEELAKKGLVVVTINYRLGVLGFLAHPELTKESPHHSSGNYGLLDQLAALKWVQRNIGAFGGDAKRVTIAGQSAGAASVHYLIASPLARGLFHRAIAESGSSPHSGDARPREDAERDGARLAESKGARSLAELRAQPARELVSGGTFRFGPVVDGWFLPAGGPAILAQGKQNDVPTLTGVNADEGSASPTYGRASLEEYQKRVRDRFGEQSEEFLRLYPARSDAEAAQAEKESARHEDLVSQALWAEDRAKTAKTRTFLYYFDRVIPWPRHPEYQAFHTSEVPYVFRNLKMLDRPWEPADWKTADLVSSYWVHFATKGDPNGPGLPEWPAFNPGAPKVMRLDDRPAPIPLPEVGRTDLLRNLLKRE
ncbi:MAG TPA: carboxylesterase family protein, partial [Armatimonadota bacterium]